MSFFSLDEVCFSSFSRTVSIGFNDFKWNKYSVVSGLIIYLVRKYSETIVGLEILLGLQGGGSKPSDNGGPGHPDPEIRRWGARSLKQNFFRPFGPQFGLKIRWVPGPPGPSPGSATGLSAGLRCSLKRSLSLRLVSPMY